MPKVTIAKTRTNIKGKYSRRRQINSEKISGNKKEDNIEAKRKAKKKKNNYFPGKRTQHRYLEG